MEGVGVSSTGGDGADRAYGLLDLHDRHFFLRPLDLDRDLNWSTGRFRLHEGQRRCFDISAAERTLNNRIWVAATVDREFVMVYAMVDGHRL